MDIIRQKDIEVIKDNIDKILYDSKRYIKNNYDIKITDYNNIFNIILDYIKEKKKIIYGGFAIDVLIKYKNKDDLIYDDYDYKDIEIYTFEPLLDLKNMCDLLYKKGYKNVVGRQAVHQYTYTISVDYQNYCDISYMPKQIYDNIPTIIINNLVCTDIILIYINKLLSVSDLVLNDWRLNKDISKMYKLQKYYKIEFNREKIDKIKRMNVDKIIDKLSKIKNIIIVGDYANNYYKKLVINNEVNKIEIISDDYNNIINTCKNILKNIYNKNIDKKKYFKFFTYLDRRTELLIDDIVYIVIYDNYNKCIPYITLENNIKIPTFNFNLMYNMILYVFYYIYKNDYYKYYSNNIRSLIKYRNKYLKDNNINILDKSPYQDLTIKCIGKTINNSVIHRQNISRRHEKGLNRIFKYEPQQKKNILNADFTFMNMTGLIDKN